MGCNCPRCGDDPLGITTHEHEFPCACKSCSERRETMERMKGDDHYISKVGATTQLAIFDTVRPLFIARVRELKHEELTPVAIGTALAEFLEGLAKGIILEVANLAVDTTRDIVGEVLALQLFQDKMSLSQTYIMGQTALKLREYEAKVDAKAGVVSGVDVMMEIVNKMNKAFSKEPDEDKPTIQ